MERERKQGINFKDLWNHHDNIGIFTPKRSKYWGLHKTTEEAMEWEVTDSDVNEDQFLDEGSDVVISWMTTMKSAGYSYEVAMEALVSKLNVVIDRVIEADILVKNSTMTFDEAYLKIKKGPIDKVDPL